MRSIVGEIRSEGSRVLNDERLNGHATGATARLGIASFTGTSTFKRAEVIDNLRLERCYSLCPAGSAVDTWLSVFLDCRAARRSGRMSCQAASNNCWRSPACVTEPKILLCDEPSLGLSPAMTWRSSRRSAS